MHCFFWAQLWPVEVDHCSFLLDFFTPLAEWRFTNKEFCMATIGVNPFMVECSAHRNAASLAATVQPLWAPVCGTFTKIPS